MLWVSIFLILSQIKKQTNSKSYETPEALSHRNTFASLRNTLSELMISADEKNHVLWNANQELAKQVHRIETIYPYVQGEVSEEARLGSLAHWAYTEKSTDKPVTGSERPRREAASTHHAHGDAREGPTRKPRRNRDLDADDPRTTTKKQAGKARGGDNAATGANVAAPQKRRRVEKPPPPQSSVAMERSVSSTTNTAARQALSKDMASLETNKKKPRTSNAATSSARKR